MSVRTYILILIVVSFYSCDSRVDPMTVNCNLSDLQLTIGTLVDASDCSAADGSVELEASGGVGDYTFSINGIDFQSAGSFPGIGTGNYTATLRDGEGCERTEEFTILSNSQLVIDDIITTETGCGESNGSITVTATGGQNIEYSLDQISYSSDNVFVNLAAGPYTVTVRDNTGCEFSETVTLKTGLAFTTVKDIINLNCSVTDCHVSGGQPGQSRNFEVDQNIVNNAENIVRVINSTNSSEVMPPPSSGLSLTAEEKQQIACWVDDGANLN